MNLCALLSANLSCEVRENVSLASFCTFRVGGLAEVFVVPNSAEEVQKVFRLGKSNNFPVVCLGGGSNVLFADGVFRGAIVYMGNFSEVSWLENESEILVGVGAGCNLRRLVSASIKRGVSGLEFAVGIPGTVGGAIVGNAGAQGRGMCEQVKSVRCVNGDGELQIFPVSGFSYGYRYSSLAENIVLDCLLKLKRSSVSDVISKCREYWSSRASQPFRESSAGCIFKNPHGDSAGRMLDETGCKGLNVGGAFVSDMHANFFINKGGATAAEMMSLIEKCRRLVFEKKGILLECEVKTFGF